MPSQIDEVLQRFDLYGLINPFARCLVCNGVLVPVGKADILDRLEPKTRLYYEDFHQCADCRRIYWEGSHMGNMRKRYPGFLVP
ncbi:Mut7-C RNAse domain-containing protein [Methylobacter svalbardensis]|uniref:Mut7-C RNAse domain-containing protein n=1 Tax=Methylobacter svalbardensis TaxID=3080016 RepID=UPI003BB54A79